MAETKTTSREWTIIGLLWGTQTVAHIIRVSLGVAAPTLMKLYHIAPGTMGYVLSGWNWAYTACMLMVGPIVDQFGSFVVMGIGSGIWGLATLALPLFASAAVSLFLMRALFGFGHSMMIPAQAATISHWFGPERRATALGFCFSGGMVGLAIGSTVAAFILQQLGWKAIFYCIGGLSLLLTLLWFVLYPEKKIGHQESLGHAGGKGEGARVPMLSLLRHRSTWGIAFGQMGYLYAYFFFITWLPGYLILERKMGVLKTGIVGSLPFWMGMIGTIGGGMLGDHLMRRGFSRTVARKGVIGTGLTLAMITVVAAAFTESTWMAVALLTLCMGCMRTTTGSANCLPVDLAPPGAVGSLTSIQNFAGNVGGLLAPIVTGYIVEASGSFVWALVAAGGMVLFGAISYVFIVGPVEPLKIESRVATLSPQPAV